LIRKRSNCLGVHFAGLPSVPDRLGNRSRVGGYLGGDFDAWVRAALRGARRSVDDALAASAAYEDVVVERVRERVELVPHRVITTRMKTPPSPCETAST